MIRVWKNSIPKIEDILHLFLFTYNLQLTIRGDQFLENLFAILRFEADRNVAKLQKPVDKDKWATEPAVVNAFYNPNKNDIGKSTFITPSIWRKNWLVFSTRLEKKLMYNAL